MISLLGTAKLVFTLVHKVIELHESGVGQEIVDHIHGIVSEVKQIVDDHHEKHVVKRGES